jgi:hypothetical protein
MNIPRYTSASSTQDSQIKEGPWLFTPQQSQSQESQDISRQSSLSEKILDDFEDETNNKDIKICK